MARTPYITKILEVKDKDTIIVMGIGKPKTIQLPKEVVEWVSESKVAIRILDELIGHYKFRTRLAHPGAIRSLILLLYSRAHGVAPYKTARKYGVAPEQLYRIERGLKKDGLYEFVINLLSLEEYRKP
ncbi:MAG: hypothetical protein GSR77_02485 [Desulfurococcales archaeon]|nr:hypothetical protein [Desulfurococcales archaeon]